MDAINWVEIIQGTLYLIVGLLVPFVLTYIKNNNHTEKFNSVLEYAEITVYAMI
ncbi:hypothetical protein [Cytobacillus sp. IB215665]|uniref:hypothetical protein n=1 Tax=Cytobacillus sp. IB215665 TaxID=3097357 RepID=UPI002A152126|nr:hypothetical protein [Cytobacillus sp. IB215665]MDX8365487.1 hypothetical protein [Cytobacillus sp. IB215665]